MVQGGTPIIPETIDDETILPGIVQVIQDKGIGGKKKSEDKKEKKKEKKKEEKKVNMKEAKA